MTEPLLAAGIALALLAAFLNGYNDSGNVVATIVSSGAMPARRALLMAATAEFVGPFIFGVAVATTIGSGIVELSAVTLLLVVAALLATNLWSLGVWYLGLPSSASHTLVGALVGAALIAAGPGSVQLAGIAKVALVLLASPVLGLLAGYALHRSTLSLATGATPSINRFFRRAQVVASAALGISHGNNNAQNAMGVITLLLVTGGLLGGFAVPLWVVVASAASFSLGTAVGGWRVMRTLGMRLYRIRPVHGFSAQVSATGVILAGSLLGGPVSTTHVVGSAIMGAGAADRVSKVRWLVARNILAAWVVTLPGAALLAAILYVCAASLLGIM